MTPKIIYMTNIDRRYFMMRRALDELIADGEMPASSQVVKTEDGSVWSASWEEKLRGSALVMIRFMGNTIRTKFWTACMHFLSREGIPYYMDAAGSAEEECVERVAAKDIEAMKAYSFYGGLTNYKNLWLYVRSLFDQGMPYAEPPSPICWAGIYHPGMAKKFMTDLSLYEKAFLQAGRPTLGLLFYRDEWIWDDLHYQKAFIEEAERQGLNVIAVFTNGLPDPKLGMPTIREVFEKYFMKEGKPLVDAIVNVMKFSFTTSGSISIKALEEMGVPVLEAYSLIAPKEEWEASPEGMNAMEISISVTMPEFDGIIHGMPIAAKHVKEDGEVEYLPIPERMRAMVSRAGAWARLHRKPNAEKKIAIIFHNYPPKNSNIGSAYGLDSIESVRRLLGFMKEAGYQVDFIPEDTETFMKRLTAQATNDRSMLTEEQEAACQKISKKVYCDFFDTFPEETRRQMEKDWGKAPGRVMTTESGDILVPGLMDGHIFLTVQAPRGYGFDASKIYHDPFIAPTHQYLAYYQWIRDVWGADAVVHVGTHGNLEWLPGKSAGMDRGSYPDLALGSLPNIYPYHMTITGEGIQAKRRGGACLVDHLPAPMEEAGTYEELAELEQAMDEYAHFEKSEPETAKRLVPRIRELAEKASLDGEVPYTEADLTGYLSRLHCYIEDLKNSECHVGLHILGEMPKGETLIHEILALLRLPNRDIPSICELLAEEEGTSVDTLLGQAQTLYPNGLTGGEWMARLQRKAEGLVRKLAEMHFDKEKAKALGTEREQPLLRFVCEEVYPRLAETKKEMEHTLRGLSAHYIVPGISGSPHAGGVSLLPAGVNFYGIDPRRLPTRTAWEVGKELGDQVISQYIESEGRYPESVGMVFWSGANMRSHGQCIAEFLYLMGIRPIWEPGSLYVKRMEPIPLSELQRPRIDVTARISGLFRDTMPSVVSLMDRAVLLAASLAENAEDNYVRKHISEDSRIMEEKGSPKEEAWREAAYRIFGDAPGTYGAGVAALLEEKNWDSLDDLANVFIRWGGHAYGSKSNGDYKPELFRERLAHMEVTIKNEDNHETNMMSSDDYNAYHGGLIAAVRSCSGKKPHAYEGDSSDRSRIKVRTVEAAAKRIFRTETVNPKFIEGLMQHGYKGAADLSNRVAVSFQWDATSDVMEDWMYEKLSAAYALDPKVQDWMKRVNPWALSRITETLLEAARRGLWQAKEETVDALEKLYLEVEGEIEEE